MGLLDFLFKKKSAGYRSAAVAKPADRTVSAKPPPIAPVSPPSARPTERRAPTPIPLPQQPEAWNPSETNPNDADTDAIQANPIAQAIADASALEPVAPTELPSTAGMDTMAPLEPAVSAEQACGVDPATMDRDTIRKHLAVLYRRYNAAAASLDAGLRAESETMLDHIVACREKYVEPTA